MSTASPVDETPFPSPLRVGFVGCGTISGQYAKACLALPALDVVAVSDLDPAKAVALAATLPGARPLDVADLLERPDVDAVLNLTLPATHAELALAAVKAGKHVYGEKPLATNRVDGLAVLDAAREAGLQVGCAPDTVLGGGVQTARALLDSGAIGEPVAATAFMVSRGVETWHPNPEFYYKQGGGPVWDMAPYYLSALVTLLGPVRRVTASSRIAFPQRTITSQPLAGQVIDVEVDTHVTGVLETVAGPLVTFIMSFDVWTSRLPRIEVYGSEGTLDVPDPNGFDAPVGLWRQSAAGSRHGEWTEVAPNAGFLGTGRGVGLADMARSVRNGERHRANGEIAFHVLDIMQAIGEAAESGAPIELTSTCARPEAVPSGARPGID